GENAGEGFECIVALATFASEPLHNTASPIATGLSLSAVTIDDLNIIIAICRARKVDGHDLIEGCFAFVCQTDCGLRRDPVGSSAHISNNDLVAQSVHLGESSLFH